MKVKSNRLFHVLAAFFALCASVPSLVENYYRWTDANGVVHYGSRPPDGVDAVKIDTYGKSKGTEINGDAAANADAKKGPESTEQALKEQRKSQCEEERERLSVLTSSGSRIKMKQPDGSARFISPEELAAEVKASREFIEQACN